MKPADDMEQLVRQLTYRASPGFKDAARGQMLAELDQVAPSNPRPLWRKIVSSKITRYATPVAIAVALAVVVFRPGGSSQREGVVWAEVLEKIQAIDTMIHQEQREFYRPGENKPFLQGRAVKYASHQLGQVEKQYDAEGKPLYLAYFLKKEKRVVVLFPAVKTYLDLPLTGKLAAISDDVSPKGLVQLLTRHGYTKLGRATFRGQEVEGFEAARESIQAVLAAFTDYKEVAFLFPVKSAAARIWVDVETSLPVGVEAELETGRGLLTGFQEGQARFTAYDFQWGAEIDPKIFVPDIPRDYERIDLKAMSKQAR
jgi:hypothetical protein